MIEFIILILPVGDLAPLIFHSVINLTTFQVI